VQYIPYTTGPANQLESDGIYRYEYDGEGNQIKRIHLTTGETRTLEYDHRNRLVRVDDWSGDPGDPNNPTPGVVLTQSVEYTYDALGRRIARTVDADGEGPQAAEREFFVYNGDNVWADFDEVGEVVARYLFGNGIDSNIARWWPGEGTVWYLTDRLGSIRDLADVSGDPINHSDFDSFGKVIRQTNLAAGDRFNFQSRELDTETGHYFFRARFYSPRLGRFVSEDPLGFQSGDLNVFRFVGNSQSNGSDPSGRLTVTEGALLGASFGFASGLFTARICVLGFEPIGIADATVEQQLKIAKIVGVSTIFGAFLFAGVGLGSLSTFEAGAILTIIRSAGCIVE
jgi:RHS repeat-associated protein